LLDFLSGKDGWEITVKALALAICSVVLLAAVSVNAEPTNGLVSKPYEIVRKELMRRGFRPLMLKHDQQTDLYCYEGFCSRYPEVMNCPGTGLNPCQFAYIFSASKRYFIVDTHGETRLSVTGVHLAHDYELRDLKERS